MAEAAQQECSLWSVLGSIRWQMMDWLCFPLVLQSLSITILPLNCFPRCLRYFDTIAVSALASNFKSYPIPSTTRTWLLSLLHVAIRLHTLTDQKASVIFFAVRAAIWTEGRGRKQSAYRLGDHHTGKHQLLIHKIILMKTKYFRVLGAH